MEQPQHPDRPAVPAAPPVPAASPAGAAEPLVPRGRRLRLLLAVLAGVMALGCLGGAGVLLVLYDDATKIDRSAPDVVVDSYLRAELVSRDDKAAALLTCANPDLRALQEFRADIEGREKKFSTRISVNWGQLLVQQSAGSATVTTDLVRSLDGGAERDRTTWAIRAVDEDGWRVCSAAKTG